jgi:hypothetical protein
MLMRMLAAGGMEIITDEVRRADEDNPHGYFEFEKVKSLREDTCWLPATRGKAFKMVVALVPFLPLTHTYKILLMQRQMAEVIASQNKMLARMGQAVDHGKDQRMAALLEKQMQSVIRWAASQPQVELLPISYHRVISDARGEAGRVAAFLGRPLDVDRMASAVEARLYRNRLGD